MSAPRCPDTVHGQHGPAGGRGRCPWCGTKYTSAAPAPGPGDCGPSDLTEAYDQVYDPDYGALDWRQIERRYRLGQAQ